MPLHNKGLQRCRVLTAGGEVELQRSYRWAPGQPGLCPADAALGIARQRVSPGACEICCRLGMVENFAQAALDARRIGNVPLSRERLRHLVEHEAQAMRQQRDSGEIPASWSARDAKVEGSNRTRVYHGSDGVMVPTVTQAEKDLRRQKHITRRQQRGKAGLGNAKPLPSAKAGTDQRFKEFKIGLFYDQEKQHRQILATEAASADYGPLVASHGTQIGFAQAQERIAVVDGAVWIYQQLCGALGCLGAILLDFYHLAQHVHHTAMVCLGETPAAEAWGHQRLQEFKEQGPAAVLAAIDALHQRQRSPGKRQSLRELRDYVVERLEMLAYPQALARGWDIGSGPTEATCKTLTMRLKQSGMKWDRDNAAAMMNLTALYDSGQAQAYWEARKHAA